jgi:hypothetical protein
MRVVCTSYGDLFPQLSGQRHALQAFGGQDNDAVAPA